MSSCDFECSVRRDRLGRRRELAVREARVREAVPERIERRRRRCRRSRPASGCGRCPTCGRSRPAPVRPSAAATSGSRPAGILAPNSTSASAWPPSSPGSQAYTRASAARSAPRARARARSRSPPPSACRSPRRTWPARSCTPVSRSSAESRNSPLVQSGSRPDLPPTADDRHVGARARPRAAASSPLRSSPEHRRSPARSGSRPRAHGGADAGQRRHRCRGRTDRARSRCRLSAARCRSRPSESQPRQLRACRRSRRARGSGSRPAAGGCRRRRGRPRRSMRCPGRAAAVRLVLRAARSTSGDARASARCSGVSYTSAARGLVDVGLLEQAELELHAQQALAPSDRPVGFGDLARLDALGFSGSP